MVALSWCPSSKCLLASHCSHLPHFLPTAQFWVCLYPGWGGACLHCVSWMASGEAEAPGRAEEWLCTPAHLPIQSFGDYVCMTVGRDELEHKGLSTWSASPKKQCSPCWAFPIPKIILCLLKFTRPSFTLKYKWKFWGIFQKSENHLHLSFIFTSKRRQDIKGRANGVAHLHTNTYMCAPHSCSSSSPEEDLLVRKSRPWLLCLPRLRTSLTAPWIAQLVKWIYYIKSKRLNYHRQPIISWRSQGSISLLLTL